MFNGSDFILKIKNDNLWEVITGMRMTKFNLSNKIIKDNSIGNSSWQKIAGISNSYLNISVRGVITNSPTEKLIRKNALKASISEYEISFGNEVITGKFMILGFECKGSVNEEQNYSFILESSDKITKCIVN